MIYKVQAYQEHARLITVYTPLGKKTLIAQGAQKTNNSNRVITQYLTLIDFKENIKTFYTLSEAKIVNDFQNIKADYNRTKYAALILEVIDHVTFEDDQHLIIYLDMLLALEQEDLQTSSLSFAVKMLKHVGYEPDLVGDGRELKGFSIALGRIVYQDESHPIDLDIKETTALLRLSFLHYPYLIPVDPPILPKIKDFIFKYYQFHLQTTLKNLQ